MHHYSIISSCWYSAYAYLSVCMYVYVCLFISLVSGNHICCEGTAHHVMTLDDGIIFQMHPLNCWGVFSIWICKKNLHTFYVYLIVILLRSIKKANKNAHQKDWHKLCFSFRASDQSLSISCQQIKGKTTSPYII